MYNIDIHNFIFYYIIFGCNSSSLFRPKCRAIFRLIVEQVECTVDNAFNLRDLVLQELELVVLTTCKTHVGLQWPIQSYWNINLLKPTGYVMHHQFNIQQLYVLPTLYLCVLYLSENKQRLVPLTA